MASALSSHRFRSLQVVAVFVVVFIGLHVLALSPDPVLFGALAVVVLCLVAAADADTAAPQGPWTAADLSSAVPGRGADHVTTALARDLSQVRDGSEAARELAVRVHRRICAIIESRVWRTPGVDLRSNPEWAGQLLPEDLADVYLADPDPRLLRLDWLGAIVARMEAW